MIKTISNSHYDNEKISNLLTPMNREMEDFSFGKTIVKKPWGYEYILYENKFASAWILFLNKDNLTSMHCHLNKKTALLLLSGEIAFTTLDKGFILKEGEGIILEKKVFHSSQAISEGGAIIMEIETPVKKTDLLRLSDLYGRESKGYESEREISKDTEGYCHVHFEDEETSVIKRISNMEMSMHIFDDELKTKDFLKSALDGTYILFEGKIFNEDYGEFFDIGDLFSARDIKNIDLVNIVNPIRILKVVKTK